MTKLDDADAMLAVGTTVAQVVQSPIMSEPTVARWRNAYGGMQADVAGRLTELELEHVPFSRLTDQSP